MINSILFDMDGVLIDSEPLHLKAYIHAFSLFNYKLDKKTFLENWTKKGKSTDEFIKENNLDLNAKKIRSQKRKFFRKNIHTLKKIKNIEKKIIELENDFKLCLVTSSSKIDAKLILKYLKIQKNFKKIIGYEDVKNRKPHPEPFLLALKKLNITKNQAVVIEDAYKGIISAKKAGIKTIAIPNKWTKDNDFRKADLILNSIFKLNKSIIRSL